MNQPCLPRVHLAPQVGNVGLDNSDLPTEVVIPDVVENPRFAENRPGVDHEVSEQCELGGRECNQLALLPDLAGVVVEFDVGELHPRRLLRRDTATGAAQAYRKSVVSGRSVSVRVDLGVRRTIYKNRMTKTLTNVLHTTTASSK